MSRERNRERAIERERESRSRSANRDVSGGIDLNASAESRRVVAVCLLQEREGKRARKKYRPLRTIKGPSFAPPPLLRRFSYVVAAAAVVAAVVAAAAAAAAGAECLRLHDVAKSIIAPSSLIG